MGGKKRAVGGKKRAMVNRPATGTGLKLDLERIENTIAIEPGCASLATYVDRGRRLSIMVAREAFDGFTDARPGLHISVASPDRYPSWDELVAVKTSFAPDIELAIYLPPRKDYVNVHENCFHMWQVPPAPELHTQVTGGLQIVAAAVDKANRQMRAASDVLFEFEREHRDEPRHVAALLERLRAALRGDA